MKNTLTKLPRAEQWATEICAQLRKSVESIIDVGRLLVKAKADLAHGEWVRMFEDSLVPFTVNTAQRLMKVAEHPQISNAAHAQYLPPSWYSLYELTKVEPQRLTAAFKDGIITPDMERRDVSALLSQERRTERIEKLATIAKGNTELATDVKYPVIYADPPWRYEHVKTESRAIENQYPTMALDEICALPLGDVTTDDALLFLWATSPKLAEALRVVESWGFTYRTSMVWVKDQIGMGYYARQRHELLLIATKGEPPVPAPEDRPDTVVTAPRGEHSEKPDIFYRVIERMYPTLPRLELFAREAREGWDRWGNQAA